MIVLVSADDRPAQQLLVTKRSTIGAVQALLGLQAGRAAIEWLIDDGTWASADPDARLYDLAGDLQGDGSSGKKAFRVRTADAALQHGGGRQPGAAGADAGASAPQPGNGDAACAPASPKQLAEAPPLNGALPAAQYPPAVARPTPADRSPTAAAAQAAAQTTGSPALSGDPGVVSQRGGGLQQSASQPDLAAAARSDASADGTMPPSVNEAVSRARLEATLPLLTGGSHIAVVDPRRPARDAMAAALLTSLPQLQTAQCAEPMAFRPVQLTFDRAQPFQAGLDGFWRWVLEGLHTAAPDLFPAAGLPGDASGFEEAFSADRVRDAPPVVLICSEACALAEASSWFVSRFLGTLRDMGNEQHRFFLHAVAMIGGEPLRNVDMEAYMCKMSTSLTSTLESTQSQLRKSSRGSSGKSHGSVSRRSASSAVSRRSGSTHGGSGSGKYRGGRDYALAGGSSASAASGGSGGSSGKSASAYPTAPAGVRRAVSGGSAIASARVHPGAPGGGDGSPTLKRSSASDLRRGRRSLDGSNALLAAEEAVLAARRHRRGSRSNSGAGGTNSSGGSGGDGVGAAVKDSDVPHGKATEEAGSKEPRSPVKPLSDKVKRLAAAFARGDGNANSVDAQRPPA